MKRYAEEYGPVVLLFAVCIAALNGLMPLLENLFLSDVLVLISGVFLLGSMVGVLVWFERSTVKRCEHRLRGVLLTYRIHYESEVLCPDLSDRERRAVQRLLKRCLDNVDKTLFRRSFRVPKISWNPSIQPGAGLPPIRDGDFQLWLYERYMERKGKRLKPPVTFPHPESPEQADLKAAVDEWLDTAWPQ